MNATTIAFSSHKDYIKGGKVKLEVCSFDNVGDAVKRMRQFSFTPGLYLNGIRISTKFKAAALVVLVLDPEEISITESIRRIKEKGVSTFILTNQDKLKNGNVEDNYYAVFLLSDLITTSLEYKATCQMLSNEIFDGRDIKTYHNSEKLIPALDKDGQMFTFDTNNYTDPCKPTKLIVKKREALGKKENPSYSFEAISIYKKYIKSCKLPHVIVDYSKKRGTLSIYKNRKMQKSLDSTDCFMFHDDNMIYNTKGEKISFVPFSLKQIAGALETSRKGIEPLRKSTLENIVESLNIEKEYNLVITSEGLGKSSLVNHFKTAFNRKRAIVLCKSYDQIKGKQKLYNKLFPNMTSVIIPSIDRLLNKYGISERIFVTDPETGERYLSFRASVDASSLIQQEKVYIFAEKDKYDKISAGSIHFDIILMTEEKLKMEVIMKRTFCRPEELIIFDEFNPEQWFMKRVATEDEIRMMPQKIFYQETWTDFNVAMIREDINWLNLVNGKKIVLSTEDKAILYFDKYFKKETNLIDRRKIFKTTNNVKIRSVAPKLISTKDDRKKKVNISFLSNDYLCMGNGINSKLNNVSLLGQNLHGDIDNKKIIHFLTQPCPQEIAPLMANLDLMSDEATILKMSDTANQIIGRHQGFRNQIKIKSMDILIPNNLIYKILPHFRYVSRVKKTFDDKEDMVDRILSTLSSLIGGQRVNSELFLHSLKDKVSKTIKCIETKGTAVIAKISSFKFFKFPKELIELGNTICRNYLSTKNKYSVISKINNKISNPSYRDNFSQLYDIYSNKIILAGRSPDVHLFQDSIDEMRI